MTDKPAQPTGVAIVRIDGRRRPIELEYSGWSEELGLHVWTSTEQHVMGPLERLSVDYLPAQTRLAIRIHQPPAILN